MVTSGGMQHAYQELCLHCEKMVAPSATLAIEVKNEEGTVIGYLHRAGTCKAEWDKKQTTKAPEKNNCVETQPLQSEAADGRRRLRGSWAEDEQLCDDLAIQLKKDHPPTAGDTVIFPAGHRAKIHSTFDGMAWRANQDDTMSERHIPLDDLAPSGEPNTWMYTGDTRAEK
jgi:hypothetical protein